jgi:hypothetical protein
MSAHRVRRSAVIVVVLALSFGTVMAARERRWGVALAGVAMVALWGLVAVYLTQAAGSVKDHPYMDSLRHPGMCGFTEHERICRRPDWHHQGRPPE